jgi:hypothetical protein
MSQCYIRSLYVVHFKGALDSGEAQPMKTPLKRGVWALSCPAPKSTARSAKAIAIRFISPSLAVNAPSRAADGAFDGQNSSDYPLEDVAQEEPHRVDSRPH